MIIERLRLYNFRCYEEAAIEPDPRFNVITGLNGQGKTSILEAIGLISFLRSFRNAKNTELIKLGQNESSLLGEVNTRGMSVQLSLKIWPKRKQATINGKACKFLSEYVGKISAVSFSPTDLEIIRGAPENRRNWMDKLSQLFDPAHADISAKYRKVLEQRNRLLKVMADKNTKNIPPDLSIWTEELCFLGAEIIHKRIHSVEKSVDVIAKYYGEIARQKPTINIGYISEIFEKVHGGQESKSSLELIGHSLRTKLEAALPKDLVLGVTTVGPHRDDLDIVMEGHRVQAFGSQGEVRSLVLAMRLTEAEFSRASYGCWPVLLIDDFSSELDERRRAFLLEYLNMSDSQVFLSTTEDLRMGKTFEIKDAKISGK